MLMEGGETLTFVWRGVGACFTPYAKGESLKGDRGEFDRSRV